MKNRKEKLGLAGAALLITVSGLPASAQSHDQAAATLNNDGVKALNSGAYVRAIGLFEDALAATPGYSFARENLAIAYNNYALRLPCARAVPFFKRALELSPSNATTQKNLQNCLDELAKEHAEQTSTDEDKTLLAAHAPARTAAPATGGTADMPATADRLSKAQSTPAVATYLATIEKRIRQHWLPASKGIPRVVGISFWISPDGRVSDVKSQVAVPEGLDASERKAVLDLDPVEPLPASQKGALPVLAVFTYETVGPAQALILTVVETNASPLKLHTGT